MLFRSVAPANPIRRFVVTPQLHPLIKAALLDPELEELPTDYNRGLDFNIKKTSKGGYADYSTSTWARKESALTEAELAAIEAHGLFNLADFLPKKPSEAELRIIKEMFEASVDGRPYDPDKYGAYYKPYGLDLPETANNNTVADEAVVTNTAPVQSTNDDVPFDADEPVVVPSNRTSSDKAADILAMIRNRNKS